MLQGNCGPGPCSQRAEDWGRQAPHPKFQEASRNPWSCRAPRPGLEEPQQCTGQVSKHRMEALGAPWDTLVSLCQ